MGPADGLRLVERIGGRETPTDGELMIRVLALASDGPLDIGRLARDHYDLVYRFCARRIGPDHAADAAQETFLTAQKALSKFRGESSPTTWLLGIAHNECRRSCRNRRVETALPENLVAHGDGEASLVDRTVLREALAALSEEHREAIVLKELDGLTYEEIGEVLGIPAGTAKSRVHHAFANLRKAVYGGPA